MSPPEVPLEKSQEDIMEHAHHATEQWIMGVALTAALLAALAAITALLAEHHAEEAMIDQIESTDQWNYYQAKGVKALVLDSKIQLLEAMGKSPDPKDKSKLAEYRDKQEEISTEAKNKRTSSEGHVKQRFYLAFSLTLLQVAIAIAAISVLTKRKAFWYVCMVFGLIGAVLLVLGIIAGHVH